MIRGVHTMFYTSQPEALREFLRDKLDLPATDVGGGWLIFDFDEAEMGCHPVETHEGRVPSGTPHLSFYCDDLDATMAELETRGVEFEGGVHDQGYGRSTRFRVPGDFTVEIYEPGYEKGSAQR